MKSLKQIKSLKNKRVLVRVDFNVALEKNSQIDSEGAFKIEATLPTIKYLTDKKAKVILMTHLGRPKGRVVPEFRVDPIADYLSKSLKKLVKKVDGVIGPKVEKEIAKMKSGEILMLENLRFEKGEEENDDKFARELAKLGDIYINEAFAVCHRPAASVAAITKYLPSYAGLLLEKEVKALLQVMKKPKKPLVLVMGGLKFETKLPVIDKFLGKADRILLGGGLACTCLKALGYGVGDSAVDDNFLKLAKKVAQNKKVVLPIDVIVGNKNKPCDFYHLPMPVSAEQSLGRPTKIYQLIKSPYAIYDIGPATIFEWAKLIKKAQTIIWNGPLGYFEQKPYDTGTLAMARLVASRSKGKAYGVVGGGETVTALRQTKMEEYVDHVSTGGGAMLEFLAGKKLPGITALN